MADVIVIGAGLSGLTAARAIARLHGPASVTVLEARRRVGGRVFARQAGRETGCRVDLGGQWIGEGHARMRALAADLGLQLFDCSRAGLSVLRYDGRRHLDDSPLPAPGDQDRKTAADLLDRLGQTAGTVVPDPSRPWASPLAQEHDCLTLGQWIDANAASGYARFYASMTAAFDQAGSSPAGTSLLHSLFETRAAPPEGDPERYLLRDAAGQIPVLLAAQLGDGTVRLGTRAVAVHQARDGATVGTVTERGYTEYTAKAVIMAVPPWLAGAVRYTSGIPGQPGIPARRMHLTQRMAMGTVAKAVCVYDTPWWRESGAGLSGTSVSEGMLAGATADTGPPGDEGPGILTCFIQGSRLLEWIRRPPRDRRALVAGDLADLFGEAAASPADYAEALWPQDQFSGGAYNAYLPPGGWSSFGSAIREPAGRISWAGTETAAEWYGYMEGAVAAGERAAAEAARWL